MMAQRSEELDEEFEAMLQDIGDDLTAVSRHDRWWEDFNIFSRGRWHARIVLHSILICLDTRQLAYLHVCHE